MNLPAIDIPTIIFLLFLGNLMVLLLFTGYIRQILSERKYILFMTAKVFQAASWFLLGLRGSIPDVLSILVANTVLFTGFSLESFALLSITKSPGKNLIRFYVIITVLLVLLFGLASRALSNIRVALASAITIVFWIIPGIAFVSAKSASLLKRSLGVLYLIFTAALILRTVFSLITTTEYGLMTSNLSQSFTFLALFILMLLGSIGYLLLAKEQGDRELKKAATVDSLTGILNRKSFIDRAERVLALSARFAEPVSMLMMDLDHFKRINDKHGHQVGDRVLQDFTSQVKKHLRSYDLFGRYGGEEFSVILPKTDKREAMLVAERIRSDVELKEHTGINGVNYTVSIGVCTAVPEVSNILDEMFRTSDKALYLAKTGGRNKVAGCSEEENQDGHISI